MSQNVGSSSNVVAEFLAARGFSIADLTDENKSAAALAALAEAMGEKTSAGMGNSQAVPSDYFSRPVPIAFYLTDYREVGGQIEIVRYRVVVRLKRERAGDALMSQLRATLVGDQAENGEELLMQFCNLLYDEPTGFEGFPMDARLLKDRAFGFFSARPGSNEMIETVFLHYRTAVSPSEFFR